MLGWLVTALSAWTSAAATQDASTQTPAPPVGVSFARFIDIFTPLRTDQAALSPDGTHLAYSWHDGRELSVAVVAVDNPKVTTTKVVVALDPDERKRSDYIGEYPLAQVRFLGWTSNRRVVLQTNTRAAITRGMAVGYMRGVWFSFDLDGKDARVLFDPRKITRSVGPPGNSRLVPLQLTPVDVDPTLKDGVYLRGTDYDHSNPQRPVPKEIWYRANALDGSVRRLSEKERLSAVAAVEAHRKRFSDSLRDAADELRPALPGMTVDLLACSDDAGRFLARTQACADAGAFHVFDRAQRRSYEILRRAPHLDTERTARVLSFEYAQPTGSPLRGSLVLPRHSRLRPYPVLVICPTKFNHKHLSRFRPEILAFADMGLAVLQLEGPTARLTDRAAIAEVTHELFNERLVATIDAVAKEHPISPKRAILYGEYDGALQAVRLLHQRPERFRGVVAWRPALASSRAMDDPRLSAAQRGQPPILFLSYPGPTANAPDYRNLLRLDRAIRGRGGDTVVQKLTADDFTEIPRARAATFREIETFVNLNLYDYTVELGDLIEATD